MSTSQSQVIPIRRVLLTDDSQLPSNYSSTPGGTLYSTTPNGTRLVYDRSSLLHLRNSPLSQTPPQNVLSIPNILVKEIRDTAPVTASEGADSPTKKSASESEESQFEIDL
ncbi:eukaryotic translation initiation factor 4E-binding protein 1 [Diaphorina citri]|uniref:Eukaryotic translation initiation factor 4E-binding protein 1 n=1 Tax=Diaphorina citri TaxID=121845 RepID=A0A1S3CVJ4_DIACI|nr:eukaryotic translation initiation factor 4E-binding protein 1 [Diaphorina citri]KAI5712573.1 hypothetical protein M8J75_009559 [Diaphorina citri]KAI5749520.1 hypothetical protein M8J76_008011 [Diaphorina citri]KAI5756041.1 hypothetical protein M8J77_021561 [Diaphorina citri]